MACFYWVFEQIGICATYNCGIWVLVGNDEDVGGCEGEVCASTNKSYGRNSSLGVILW